MKCRWFVLLLVVSVLNAFALADDPPAKIAITLDAPYLTRVTHWPMTVGVPFPKGHCTDIAAWTVINGEDQSQPCQFDVVSKWPDGSVRWATLNFEADLSQKYFVTQQKRADADDDIRIEQRADGVTVHAGGAQYVFTNGKGCFDQLILNGKPLAEQSGDAFYVIDSKGQRGIMAGDEIKVERNGARQAVVKVKGDYRTDTDERNAHGIVYFYFHAGRPWVRISHKLIFTEQTLDLWFRDIGVDLPLQLNGNSIASFNTDHRDPTTYTQVQPTGNAIATMVQHDFPHFGSESSRFTVTLDDKLIAQGRATGDWADVSSATHGLSAQLPAFAEQFPKAFAVGANRLVIKLWASECGRELDFRTETVIREYFGHDWIPADHKVTKMSNTAQGAARTHDFWLYPHAGAFEDKHLANLGATKHEIYAVLDPIWISDARVMDHFMPEGASEFDDAEIAIRDFFHRNIDVPERIFPNTGFLAWGRNPYTSQNWKLKNGKWYPTIHRFGRVLEYNLKRAIWILYFRSGEREYREYATRYTRFLHDFNISNWDTPIKPHGWFIQGTKWQSPCFWGAFDEKEIREGKRDYFFVSTFSCLGYGTSEDVIQYVYHYFNSGDFHCRDAAMHYKEAAKKEMAGSVEKALSVTPSYVLLRPFGSAYEIDQDPEWYAYCHKFLKAIVGDGSDVINRSKSQNYLKDGEIWTGFYNYYNSTGDELALGPILRAAERYYRTNRFRFISRGSSLFQVFAYAYAAKQDTAYLAWIRQGLDDYAKTAITMHDRGIDRLAVDRRLQKKWGHNGAIVKVLSEFIGAPVAMRVLTEQPQPNVALPLALKLEATPKTHLLFKKLSDKPGRIDMYVNNIGDLKIQPRLLDQSGKVLSLQIETQQILHPDKPRGDTRWQHQFNHLYNMPGTHCFYRLQIDAPSGVYELGLGDEIAMRVLYSDMNQFLQVAPQGMVLEKHRKYFFPVPAGTDTVEFFAHRPAVVYDPLGRKVELEEFDAARYRFATQGMAGIWCIEGGSDRFTYQYPITKTNVYVKFENIPNVLANDDISRIFEFDSSRFVAPQRTPAKADDGRFGKAALLARNEIIEVPVKKAGGSMAIGTVEFWYRAGFSVTDWNMKKSHLSSISADLLRLSPIHINYAVSPVDGGRTGHYHRGRLHARLLVGDSYETYPTSLLMQDGKWYHIAVTWHVDGKDTDLDVFINGRKKMYAFYRGGISRELKPADLAPAEDKLRFGSAIGYGYNEVAGQLFDEVRVSNVVRYTEDFEPATQPFTTDVNTVLLLHLDEPMQKSTARKLDK